MKRIVFISIDNNKTLKEKLRSKRVLLINGAA